MLLFYPNIDGLILLYIFLILTITFLSDFLSVTRLRMIYKKIEGAFWWTTSEKLQTLSLPKIAIHCYYSLSLSLSLSLFCNMDFREGVLVSRLYNWIKYCKASITLFSYLNFKINNNIGCQTFDPFFVNCCWRW